MSKPLLDISEIIVEYRGSQTTRAIDHVTFQMFAGENLGVVGESGCGKTTLARAIMGLLPRTGTLAGGNIFWDGTNVTNYTNKDWANIRWKDIALIPQSAMNSLDPVFRIRDQIIEAILAHENVSKQQANERALKLCKLVRIDPERLSDYPHQLSGGMKQRMVIAMALALNPRLIIADEPTTALDVIVQDRIIEQIVELQQTLDFAMIYISHDIAVIAETCQRIIVMYAGKIAEMGALNTVLSVPAHPYTMGLKNAFPDIRNPKPLISIPGHPPNLSPPPNGCRFTSRCPFSTDLCTTEDPPLSEVTPGQFVACHYTEYASDFREQAQQASTWNKSAS